MRWKKLGKVFSIAGTGLPDWIWSHAAVPFAMQLEGDQFRVFFSTRDSRNRSFSAYVDIDINEPQKIIAVSDKPVLAPGALGSFDEDGAMLSWITPHPGGLHAYYIGWNVAKSVPFRNSIGLAEAQDVRSAFEKRIAGPVLDRGPYDPCFVASCCVMIEKGVYRMWYLSCIEWEMVHMKPRHRYHIKYAESRDGINWKRGGQVAIPFKDAGEYAISRPSVVKDGGTYKMWYTYRGEKYRIGYAESTDGVKWRRKDDIVGIDVSAEGWDSEEVCYPHVFDHAGKRYMLYNGNGYGLTGFGLAVLED